MRWRLMVTALTSSVALAGATVTAATPALAAGPASQAAATTGSLYSFNSGLVLTAGALTSGALARVEKASAQSGRTLKWGTGGSLRPAGDSRLCLTVPGPSYRAGIRLKLASCHGGAAQRFATHAPSGHTPVYFARPQGHAGLCVTVMPGGDVAPSARAQVGLEPCTSVISQAWSATNLQGSASSLSSLVTMKAAAVTAGSAVTGTTAATANLDLYWTSSTVGKPLDNVNELHPVQDTSLCVTLGAAEGRGVPLRLETCDGAASQQFLAIAFYYNDLYGSPYLLTTPDSKYCVAPSGSKPAGKDIVIGSCDSAADGWVAALPLNKFFYSQYLELYAGNSDLEYSMTVSGTGAAGSPVTITNDADSPTQIWTDLDAGPARPPGNPDGTISLRPLSDEQLCLTVPGSAYAAGTKLTAASCDGSASQEFYQAPTVTNGRELVFAGDGQFCVAVAGTFAAGEPVELQTCDQQSDQAWGQYYGWSSFVGLVTSVTSQQPGGQAMTLSGASSAGGTVSLAASDGSSSQFWTNAPHDALRSVYAPGLCLDAPATTIGTVLDAAPCSGGASQEFVARTEPDSDTHSLSLGSSGPCVTAVSGSLELQSCVLSQSDQEWIGPN